MLHPQIALTLRSKHSNQGLFSGRAIEAPVSLFRGDYVGREQREALRDELRIRLRLRASPSSPEELPAEPASEASSVP